MIKLSGIYKTYVMGENEVHALNGVNLHITQGEYVAVVGQSGSGKSTLMNIIGCLDTPTQGSYFLSGEDVSRLSDGKLAAIRNFGIGFVFQGFNLLYTLSAAENVELPLIYQGVRGRVRRNRAREALELVGLSDRLHHRPSELSGGQQQRVAIARALVTRPPIILADEPTGNLDSRSGFEIMELIKRLHSYGNTIVVITHDDGIAARAPRMVKIMDGMIISDSVSTVPPRIGAGLPEIPGLPGGAPPSASGGTFAAPKEVSA